VSDETKVGGEDRIDPKPEAETPSASASAETGEGSYSWTATDADGDPAGEGVNEQLAPELIAAAQELGEQIHEGLVGLVAEAAGVSEDDARAYVDGDPDEDDDPDVIRLDAPAVYDDGERGWDEVPEAERVDAEVVSFDPFADDDPGTKGKKAKRLSSRTARARAEREEKGWIFTLTRTVDDDGDPQEAHVRRVTMLDRTMIGALPRSMQTRLIELTSGRDNTPTKEMTPQQLMRRMGRGEELADAYCVAGFLDPKVYATLEEAETYDGVWVKDIDIADRFAFMNACDAVSEEAMAKLKPFPG
jgi:hypothetical protein